MADSSEGFFSVDMSSGIIILEHPLDRELQSSYNVTIKASDQGIVQTLSSFATVTITVLDINDNPPVFERRDYLAAVPEDTSPSAEIIFVFATSKDIGTNAEITYLIRSGNEKGKFQIDSKTGKFAKVRRSRFKAGLKIILSFYSWVRNNRGREALHHTHRCLYLAWVPLLLIYASTQEQQNNITKIRKNLHCA